MSSANGWRMVAQVIATALTEEAQRLQDVFVEHDRTDEDRYDGQDQPATEGPQLAHKLEALTDIGRRQLDDFAEGIELVGPQGTGASPPPSRRAPDGS